ncbi:hypothetical protein DY251_11245 [Mesorhizobium denitrificans]|uniref:Uncharacterized protein n=1 Tax=Mesorhizobium denitrificans TaxID=2294114 RepID=A0A371XE97_9HYPH|nr:hypothetical protein DY251_11245 [Mesorhizobium denitrificans]
MIPRIVLIPLFRRKVKRSRMIRVKKANQLTDLAPQVRGSANFPDSASQSAPSEGLSVVSDQRAARMVIFENRSAVYL